MFRRRVIQNDIADGMPADSLFSRNPTTRLAVRLLACTSAHQESERGRGIEAMDCDYHYLITSHPADVVKYSTRLDALTALHKLMAKQAADGFTTRREPSGRYRSSHPDGRTTEFWIDDARGDIIGSRRLDNVPGGLEIEGPEPRSAVHVQR